MAFDVVGVGSMGLRLVINWPSADRKCWGWNMARYPIPWHPLPEQPELGRDQVTVFLPGASISFHP